MLQAIGLEKGMLQAIGLEKGMLQAIGLEKGLLQAWRKQAVHKLKVMYMSASTVKRRIEELAEDVKNKVIKMVKDSPSYSIHIDESTEVSIKALLLCFVKVECEGELLEELFCSLSLPGRTTSFEIFNALDSYFLEHRIEREKYIGICTDGAANMTGHRSGVVVKVEFISHTDILSTHCIVQREHIVAKKCPQNYTKCY